MKHDGLLNLKGLQAMRPHKEPFKDPVAGEAHVIVRNTTEHPLLLIAGEVLVADDSTKRARIIASDYWIPGGDQEEGFVPIVWADTVATPAQRGGRLRLQAEILGNDLRRGTVARSGKDDAWVATLQKHISGTLPAALDRKLDEAKVKALLKPLSDANVTGFAILDGNRVRGVELFGSHTLLMSFAERLVRGYVRENGATIRVKPLSADAKKSALDSVREYIDSLPKLALSPQTKRSAPRLSASVWRKHGIENITLRGVGGKVLGHGLVQDDSLIHLTVFGE